MSSLKRNSVRFDISTPTKAKPKPEDTSYAQPKNFEDVLDELGGFGFFQFFSLVLLLVLEVPTAFISFSPVFVGATPHYWHCDNGTETLNENEICGCNGTKSAPGESIVVEWELVCGSEWVADFITSVQMLGMFFGNVVACKVADWHGRRYTFFAVSLLMALGQILSAVATDPYFYAFARFLGGVGLSGYLGVAAVYSIEFQTPKWRPLAGSVGPWGEGVMLLALMAYYIRPWRQLLWATCSPFILIFFIFPFLPESPRWLLRNQKIDEAHEVMCYIAKLNRMPPIKLEILEKVAAQEVTGRRESAVKRFGYLDFFRDPNLRLPTLYQMTIMCSSAITYYGISFNVKNMQGSPYIIVTLLGLSDAIGYPSALLVCNRLGRRKSLAIYMSLGAIFLGSLAVLELTLGLVNMPTAVVVLCLLGKFCVAGGRSCARTLVGELYPTAVRGMGSGLGGVGASFGAVAAPQLAFLGTHWPAIPYFVFAFIAVGGALVSFLLTETMGRPLTDQVVEEEMDDATYYQLQQKRRSTLHRVSRILL